MTELTLISKKTQITKEDILLFEQKYQLQFPLFLRRFMTKYGGGQTEECVYRPNFGSMLVVAHFLPLWLQRNASIELILPAIQDDAGEIGRKDLIPFAIDPIGCPLYVSIGSSDYKTVYIDMIGAGYAYPLKEITQFEDFIENLNFQ